MDFHLDINTNALNFINRRTNLVAQPHRYEPVTINWKLHVNNKQCNKKEIA